MLIVCPKCATSYQVDSAALGADGRSVRCSRCQTTWFAQPPAPDLVPQAMPPAAEADDTDSAVAAFRSELVGDAASPRAEDAAFGEPAPPEGMEAEAPVASPDTALSPGPSLDDLLGAAGPAPGDGPAAEAIAPDVALPVAEAPPLAPHGPDDPTPPAAPDAEHDIETFVRRRSQAAARRRKRTSHLPLVIVGLAAVLAGLLIWRGKVVQHAPQMASLYAAIGLPVNLRGLTFSDVTTTKDAHDGVPVLVVEGKIVNTASTAVEVPRLRFAVQNVSGGEIYAWTAQPAQSVLAAGETLPFRSRLASPPADGHSVLVRFFNRRDAVSGLR